MKFGAIDGYSKTNFSTASQRICTFEPLQKVVIFILYHKGSAIFPERLNLPAVAGHGVASKFSSVNYNRLQAGCYLTVDFDFKERVFLPRVLPYSNRIFDLKVVRADRVRQSPFVSGCFRSPPIELFRSRTLIFGHLINLVVK
jgi:hypothetical protein